MIGQVKAVEDALAPLEKNAASHNPLANLRLAHGLLPAATGAKLSYVAAQNFLASDATCTPSIAHFRGLTAAAAEAISGR